MTSKKLALAAAVLLLGACAPKRIPGTDIDDTDDTRALLTVMEKYRNALETKDAESVMSLIDPTFKDNSGTTTPQDDIDYAGLRPLLQDRFAKLDNVKLEFEVKKIAVERDSAQAVYSYSSSFKMPGLTTKAMNDSELEQMTFRRQDGKWMITSGI